MNMEIVYQKIAKRHGVSVEEIRKEIQSAINYAYNKKVKSRAVEGIQNHIPRTGKIPTVEEVIVAVAYKINNLQN